MSQIRSLKELVYCSVGPFTHPHSLKGIAVIDKGILVVQDRILTPQQQNRFVSAFSIKKCYLCFPFPLFFIFPSKFTETQTKDLPHSGRDFHRMQYQKLQEKKKRNNTE